MKELKKISNSEMDIMNIIWKSEKALCVNDVFELLGNSEWKYTTIATFLTRLCKKGFLTSEKIGNQNFYSPLISQDEYLSEQTNEFVAEIYGGSAAGFIAAFAKDKISKDDYDELLNILKKYED